MSFIRLNQCYLFYKQYKKKIKMSSATVVISNVCVTAANTIICNVGQNMRKRTLSPVDVVPRLHYHWILQHV